MSATRSRSPLARPLPLLLALAGLLAASAAAAAPVPTERDEKLIALTKELDAKRQELHVPGLAIAVVQGDEVIHAVGLGLADIEAGRPASPRTVWAIGSSSKAFTSALAAMLVDEQRVAWDEPISWYLPELQLQPDTEDPKAQVTFRDALSHRSGFARMGPLWVSGQATPEQVYRTASNAEPVAPFREEFHYNNVIYTAAGDALGRAAGRPWDVLIRKRLLRPLGMRNATLDVEKAAKDDHLAVGYAWEADETAEGDGAESAEGDGAEEGEFVELPMRRLNLVQPAGSINATVLDVAQWIRFQLARGVIDGKRLVSAEQLEETWEPQIATGEKSGYGLGWFVSERGGRRVVEHGGNIDGFAAQVTLYPDDDLGYVLLMNTTASPLQQVSISLVADHLLGGGSDGEAEGGDEPLDLDDFVGDYLADFGPFRDQVFAVSVKDEKLHVNVPGQMNYELKPPNEEGKWLFALTDAIAVSFDRSEEGEVTALKMYQGGLTFELPREGFEKPAAAFPEEWRRYLGKYRSPSLGQEITVLEKNGRLALDVPGQMVFLLNAPLDGRWTFQVSKDLAVEFAQDEEGRVASATQYRGGTAVENWPRVGDAPARAAAGDLEKVLALVKAGERGRALDTLGVVRMTGSVRMLSSGLEGTVEVYCQGIDRYRQLMDQSPFVRVLSVVNGERIHVESNVDSETRLSAKQRRSLRISHPLSLFSDWRLFFDDVEYEEPGELDGTPTHVVSLHAKGLEPIRVHVDAETGDVLRAESSEPLGRGLPDIPVTTTFSEHRDVGGLRLPHRLSSSNQPTGTTVVSYEEIETRVGEPRGLFATD